MVGDGLTQWARTLRVNTTGGSFIYSTSWDVFRDMLLFSRCLRSFLLLSLVNKIFISLNILSCYICVWCISMWMYIDLLVNYSMACVMMDFQHESSSFCNLLCKLYILVSHFIAGLEWNTIIFWFSLCQNVITCIHLFDRHLIQSDLQEDLIQICAVRLKNK